MDPTFFQTNIKDFRAFIEILYFLSGPAIFIVALKGLQQIFIANKALKTANEALKTAKDDIKIRSTREALSASVAMCEKYVEKIIPEINKLNEKIKKIKFLNILGQKRNLQKKKYQ
ncbi:MAG: hypothetical protein JRI52_08890 [Deltaproteobacteria bacterium]|nr:hypothetical protein [Deltaproteobacteria bacterium]